MSLPVTLTTDLPLVSVLVRSMDRPALRETLDSIALQTYVNVEVVVVNARGGGHAALGASCGRFPLRFVNAGGSPLVRPAAANVALDAARGDWLIFLDDDDAMDPDHLERLVQAALGAPGQEVIYTGVRVVDALGLPVRQLSEPYDRVRLWQANFLPIHAVLFARTVLDNVRFDEGFDVYEDWDFWTQLACLTSFMHVPGVSATYRLTGDSGLSAAPDGERTQRGRAQFFEKWRSRIPSADLAKALARAEEARALDEQLKAAEFDYRTLESGHQALEAEYRTLESGHQALEAECHALKSGHHALEAEHRTLEAALEALEAEYRRLETGHQALQDEHRTLENRLAVLESQYRERETEIQARAAAFRNLETAYWSLEQSYHRLLGSISWRLTAPLRMLRAALSPRALLQGMIRVGRALYRGLPIGDELRLRWHYRRLQTPLGHLLDDVQTEQAVAEASQDIKTPRPDKEAVRASAEAELSAFLAAGIPLVLPAAERPRVSVLLVLFNQAGLTYACLEALARESDTAFETIIVDNASTDRTPALLDQLTGATVIRNATNEGFLLAVNRAARAARGEFLLLLNNDAVVLPDSLPAAVRRMDRDPQAGAVGGAILLWDGTLQEAGSIIWRDGSCLGYGRGDDPAAPPYDFVRDVDYCSGALLLLRRALFDAVGGFDADYVPAYYEESDFCVRLWEKGYRVIYDPAVRIRHFEFASSGERSEQAIALQVRNRGRFALKHPAFLGRQREAAPAAVLFARQRLAPDKQRILFIDDRAPRPDMGAGFPRAREFVRALVGSGHFVTHYPLQFPDDPKDKARAALPETVEIMHGCGVVRLPAFLAERQSYYDCMVVSRPHNMVAINDLHARHPEWFTGITLVYDAEALFSLREIAKAEVLGRPMPPAEQENKIRSEIEIVRIVHRIVTVSEAEAAHYRRLQGQSQVHVLGHALRVRRGGPGFAERAGYLFVGAIQSDDSPNGDSLIWFLREAWPRIRARGEVHLDVVGVCESPEVRRLATSGVHLRGQVDSIETYYDRARVFIVPTRFAAGVPHKAHEAAAHGVPMVVTPLIARQLGWGPEVEIASEGAAFADRCIGLHDDAARWQTAHHAAWAAVERDCSSSVFHRTVAEIVAAGRRE